MLSLSATNNKEELLMSGSSFPLRLHKFLSLVDELNISNIISWQPHGRCFRIHDTKKFVKLTYPSWFTYTKYSSLQRQFNIYGFQRIPDGVDKNCYYHKYFLRGHPHLLKKIIRVPLKKNIPSYSLSMHVPDFYSMPPLTESTDTSIHDDSIKEQTSSVPVASPMKHTDGRDETKCALNRSSGSNSPFAVNLDRDAVAVLVNDVLRARDFGMNQYPPPMRADENIIQLLERSQRYDRITPMQSSLLSSSNSTTDLQLRLFQTLCNLQQHDNTTPVLSIAPQHDPFLAALLPPSTSALSSLEAQVKYQSIVNAAMILNIRKRQRLSFRQQQQVQPRSA